jgi:hypothetical protein
VNNSAWFLCSSITIWSFMCDTLVIMTSCSLKLCNSRNFIHF